MANRTYTMVQLDVFTSHPLEGNQLAVVSDARGLSDEEMQKLARETNLSETTFIFPRDPATEQREGHKVRIFTVNEELPFAGHPTLGTAWHLFQQSPAEEIVLDLKVGKVPVRFERRNGELFGEMQQVEPKFGVSHPHADVATVLARMIFYNGEDPATGSAAGCCTAWAVRNGVLASGQQGMIEQGLEARRPSSIYIRADKHGDSVKNVRVGGHVLQVIDSKVTM